MQRSPAPLPPSPRLLRNLASYARQKRFEMLAMLGRLVKAESPSTEKTAVDRLAQLLAREWQRNGARVRILAQRRAGNHLRAEIPGRGDGQILILGHLDTVYPLGTIARTPFRVWGRRAFGPGALDMKSGLVIALFAARVLSALQLEPRRRLVFFFDSDEEIGSHSSRRAIEAEARRSQAVLVLEPAAGLEGALKTARKGVGEVELRVRGRAAHAGLDYEKGVSAVAELARQILAIQKFSDLRRGITVNVGVISGGTRSNVVAEEARALVDIRVARREDARPLEEKFRRLKPFSPGAELAVRGGINRPPLERTAGVVRLFRQAQALGKFLGLELDESAVGGASDGNFTAALGVATLDGLGGVGDGAHSANEFVLVSSLPERTALLAGLLLTL